MCNRSKLKRLHTTYTDWEVKGERDWESRDSLHPESISQHMAPWLRTGRDLGTAVDLFLVKGSVVDHARVTCPKCHLYQEHPGKELFDLEKIKCACGHTFMVILPRAQMYDDREEPDYDIGETPQRPSPPRDYFYQFRRNYIEWKKEFKLPSVHSLVKAAAKSTLPDYTPVHYYTNGKPQLGALWTFRDSKTQKYLIMEVLYERIVRKWSPAERALFDLFREEKEDSGLREVYKFDKRRRESLTSESILNTLSWWIDNVFERGVGDAPLNVDAGFEGWGRNAFINEDSMLDLIKKKMDEMTLSNRDDDLFNRAVTRWEATHHPDGTKVQEIQEDEYVYQEI